MPSSRPAHFSRTDFPKHTVEQDRNKCSGYAEKTFFYSVMFYKENDGSRLVWSLDPVRCGWHETEQWILPWGLYDIRHKEVVALITRDRPYRKSSVSIISLFCAAFFCPSLMLLFGPFVIPFLFALQMAPGWRRSSIATLSTSVGRRSASVYFGADL